MPILFYLIGNKILNFMCEKMLAFLVTVFEELRDLPLTTGFSETIPVPLQQVELLGEQGAATFSHLEQR